MFYWHTRKDNGQSDAINQGFSRATGDIFGWINSDDYLLPGALREIKTFFQSHPEAQVVTGGSWKVDQHGKRLSPRPVPGPSDIRNALLNWTEQWFPQQSTFWRRDLWNRCGPLREDLNYVMDYDLWFRFASQTRWHTIDTPLACYRFHSQAKCVNETLQQRSELLWLQSQLIQDRNDLTAAYQSLLSSYVRSGQRRIDDLKSSVSYRAGQWITLPCRWLANQIHGLRK